ncbi:hypothetical protein Drose_16155 [Dactylosporangium roseum]|uniref:Uncharacterized protein n=1 Tax=Dactylosporangium roseum TaxID=47989 RepID=A0ABY5ZCN2_9ACTN|nr:hypothetical protein [Dactylosporangium roseum]UWZ39617.1 hypothetical protein Drose_16155 [Dactylosporangium roseum]
MSTTPPQSRTGSPYAHLLHQIRGAGLLDRRTRYYIWKIAVTGLLFAAGWTAFGFIGDSWWVLIAAGFLAFVFTQLGFLARLRGGALPVTLR